MMKEHILRLHYQSIRKWRKQCDSDSSKQIVQRTSLYLMLIRWQRNHSRINSQASVSMSLLHTWTIEINNVQLWFLVHINCLNVSMSETQHQDEIVHRLSFTDRWLNRKSESRCEMIFMKLLLIHARWLIHLIIHDWIHW